MPPAWSAAHPGGSGTPRDGTPHDRMEAPMTRSLLVRRAWALICAMLFAAFTLLPVAAGSAQAAGTGTGSVFINKHVCPAGFDAANASYSRLALVCRGDHQPLGSG